MILIINKLAQHVIQLKSFFLLIKIWYTEFLYFLLYNRYIKNI